MIPLAVAPALSLLPLVPFFPVLAMPTLLWGISCIGYGIVLGISAGDVCAAGCGVAAMAMHAGWSFGFFKHLLTERQRAFCAARSLDPQAAP
jgi:succinoglycan biosynthesis protein ExoA